MIIIKLQELVLSCIRLNFSNFRTRSLLLVFLSAIPFASCDWNYISEVDYSICYPHKPLHYSVNAFITIDSENQNIHITVYTGTIEDQNIYLESILNKDKTRLWLKTDAYYTIMAEYTRNGGTHYVVNSLEMKVEKNCEDCVSPCYRVYGIYIDLRLKK